MYEFAPHLLVLIVGAGLSVVIFIFEIAQSNFREIQGHQPYDHNPIDNFQAWS